MHDSEIILCCGNSTYNIAVVPGNKPISLENKTENE